MYFAKWHIGLEIHPHFFCAIALQYRYHHWSLRGCWQIPLTVTSFNQQGLLNSHELIKQLSMWRTTLPRAISVRIALPEFLVFQQILTLPYQLITEQELTWYINTQLANLFPLPLDQLTIDFRRYYNYEQQKIVLTAIRTQELLHWQKVLHKAQLNVDIIDIRPTILRLMAHHASIPSHHLLLHKSDNQLTIIAPLCEPFQFSFITINNKQPHHYLAIACQHYMRLTQQSIEQASISGDLSSQPDITNLHYWSPFKKITTNNYTLPMNETLFTVPCGLALRGKDYVANKFAPLA